MGKLEHLEDELYGKEGDKEAGKRMKHKAELPSPMHTDSTIWQDEAPLASLQPAGQNSPASSRLSFLFGPKALYILSGIFLFMAVFGAAFFFYIYFQGQGNEASVEIFSRDAAESGERLTLSVVAHNLSSVVLQEAELVIVLPPGSTLVDGSEEKPAPSRIVKPLQDIPAGGEQTQEITVRMFGSEGEIKEVNATLQYRPENLRARFSSKAVKTVRINRVPIAISWNMPDAVTQGQEVKIRVDYVSNARAAFNDLSLRMEYPPGFEFKSAEPSPTGGKNIWRVGTLGSGQSGYIVITGNITGQEEEVKAFRAGIGLYNASTRDWKNYVDSGRELKISTDPLSVEVLLNGERGGTIDPGDRLGFLVHYKNNTVVPMRNVSVRLFLEGDILLLNTLYDDKGSVFDGSTKSVVWGPGGTPELGEIKPGGEGDFSISMQTRAQPIITTSANKNLTIRLRAEIKPAVIPPEYAGTDLTSEDRLDFKVNSKVIFSGKSVYHTSPIPNFGPIPPKVGQETSYAMVWEIKNFTNDLKNAEIRSTLPPNIIWKGVISPSEAKITYNDASGEVRWNIGDVPAGTGIISKTIVGAFMISVIPSEADAGKTMTLVNRSVLTALDDFSGNNVKEEIAELTMQLEQDTASEHDEWQVVE